MAKKTTKPAKPKAAAKKPAPAKAKTPAPKNKPAVKKPAKPAAAKKPAPKKPAAPAKKAAPAVKKPVAKKPAATVKKPVAKQIAKPVAKKPVAPVKKAAPVAKKPAPKVSAAPKKPIVQKPVPPKSSAKPNGWLAKQRVRLLQLKDELLDSMSGVGRDTLRTRAEGSDASAFGMHTGDAGSDAYDRDFALSLLSKEGDSLFEIDAALKKIDDNAYGVCEMSGKPIPHARLEALPFARYTVECQAELEKNNRFTRARQPVTSLFGLGEEDSESEDEETQTDTKE
jgi:RNA polymerase-binding transcription factor DksA